jgi:hypothetical protein
MSSKVGVNQIIKSFLAGKSRSIKNDKTNGDEWTFHGNRIAWRETLSDGTPVINITLCGWGTITTRLRLNALLDAMGVRGGFSQAKRVQYFGGIETDTHDVWTLYPNVTTAVEVVAPNTIVPAYKIAA